MSNWIGPTVKQVWNYAMNVLNNFFGFNIKTTAFCLGRSSLHILLPHGQGVYFYQQVRYSYVFHPRQISLFEVELPFYDFCLQKYCCNLFPSRNFIAKTTCSLTLSKASTRGTQWLHLTAIHFVCKPTARRTLQPFLTVMFMSFIFRRFDFLLPPLSLLFVLLCCCWLRCYCCCFYHCSTSI